MVKILVVGKILEIGLELLKDYNVEMYNKEELIFIDELIECVKDKDVLLSLFLIKVLKEVIDVVFYLKIVVNYGVGYDNIDYMYVGEKGIVVMNILKVLMEVIVELIFVFFLVVVCRIFEGDMLCCMIGFNGWVLLFFLGWEVYGKIIGIIGFGEIGKVVVKCVKVFGMDVLYIGLNCKFEVESELGVMYVMLEELL